MTSTPSQVAYQRRERHRRLQEDPSIVEHGKASTYSNWGCTCEDCTEAHKARCRDYWKYGRRK